MAIRMSRFVPGQLRQALRHAARAVIPSLRHLEPDLRLKNMAQRGFSPALVLDIGAASGSWARLAAGVWPHARVFGVEPNEANRAALERTRAELPSFDYWLGLVGPEAKQRVEFRPQDVDTSVLSETEGEDTAVAKMLTVDELLEQQRLPAPDFVKLDVQGYELEVLRGASRALEQCQAILLEVSFRRFWRGAPVAHEVIAYLVERGFVWYDVAGILRLAPEDELAQMDLVFVRVGNPLLQTSRWPWPVDARASGR